jgi:hypothetical protein
MAAHFSAKSIHIQSESQKEKKRRMDMMEKAGFEPASLDTGLL